MSDALTAFITELEHVLLQLYSPTALDKSPLLACFALTERHNPQADLRKTIINAIHALKPADDVPPHAMAWRTYNVLTYRYVEQLTQREVAAELALSVRQLRRHEKKAIQTLAEYLQRHSTIDLAMLDSQHSTPSKTAQTSPASHRNNELAWLKASQPTEVIAARQLIEAVLKTAAPLAQHKEVEITFTQPKQLPQITGQLAVMREALLSLLTAFINALPGSRLHVTATPTPQGLGVQVTPADNDGARILQHGNFPEKLAMTRQLCTLFGGDIEIGAPGKGHSGATLFLPIVTQIPVLALDDNVDTLKLLERYLAGSPYQLTGLRDPAHLFAQAESTAPHIIILDIMLPGIDGWELLGRLRAHPITRDIPVIICTILPQEQLALALGAAAFLRKPINREVLLQTMNDLLHAHRPPSARATESN